MKDRRLAFLATLLGRSGTRTYEPSIVKSETGFDYMRGASEKWHCFFKLGVKI